jgi:hypothetical protein
VSSTEIISAFLHVVRERNLTGMTEPKLRISTPSDLVAAVPYLLGFTPVDSLVVVGLQRRRVIFELRLDIPEAADQPLMAEYAAAVVARQGVTGVLVVGYGSPELVSPAVEITRLAFDAKKVPVLEMLRVENGRYWSYVCERPECCPPEGTPFQVAGSRVAAEATYAGMTVTASRDDIVQRLSPVTGERRLEMTRATALAETRLARLIDGHPNSLPSSLLLGAGMGAVDIAVGAVKEGRPLRTDEVAWLSLLLVNLPVRDYAWDLVGKAVRLHVGLWTEVVRMAAPDRAAAPATLLAYAAWRAGEGAVTSIALERAFMADPDYSMAHLLRQAIEGGLSPSEYVDLMENPGGSTGAPSAGRSRRGRNGGSHAGRKRGRHAGGRGQAASTVTRSGRV